MVTKFQLLDAAGETLADGEIDNGIYRLFSKQYPAGYEEFEDLAEMLATSGGVAIQPELFQTPAGTQQLGLFQTQVTKGDKENEGNKTPNK